MPAAPPVKYTNLNVPLPEDLYTQMKVYKAKIHAKTWEDYFWLTSQDADGEIMCDVLGVDIQVGDIVHHFNARTLKFDPPIPKSARTHFISSTILLGDCVYRFNPLDEERLKLVKVFTHSVARRPSK